MILDIEINAKELVEKAGIKNGNDGADGKNGVNGKDGLDGINGIDGKDGSPDKGEQIVVKINELPIEPDFQIEKTHIKGLDGFIDKPVLDRAVSILDQRTSFLINKVSNLKSQVDAFSPSETDPIWAIDKPSYVPYTGATSNLNLGVYALLAGNVQITGFDSVGWIKSASNGVLEKVSSIAVADISDISTTYLNLSGSNANAHIDIGNYDFTSRNLFSNSVLGFKKIAGSPVDDTFIGPNSDGSYSFYINDGLAKLEIGDGTATYHAASVGQLADYWKAGVASTGNFSTTGSLTANKFIGSLEPTLDSALLSWYRFDDGAGVDYMGYYNLTPTNVTLNSGVYGKAGYFNGSATIVAPNNTMHNPGTNSFSWSAWIKTIQDNTATNKNSQLVSKGHDGNPTKRIRMFLNPQDHLQTNINDGTNNGAVSNGTAIINNGAWHHIVMVVNRGDNTLKQYVDGVQDGSTTSISSVGDLTNTYPFEIGSIAASSLNVPYNGYIDDVNVYTKALSTTEIAKEYATGLSVVQNLKSLYVEDYISTQYVKTNDITFNTAHGLTLPTGTKTFYDQDSNYHIVTLYKGLITSWETI